MTIVKNGQPVADIVVAADASAELKNAALTLQHYIAKSSGATLSIRNTPGANISIHLQNAASPTLDQDGFILQGINATTFIIAGGSDQGTEFGVYEFLERYLGVRWLMPGELGEDIPVHRTLDIPSEKIQQEPVYLSRKLGPGARMNRDFGTDGEWAFHNRAVWRESSAHNLLNLFPPKEYAQTHPEFYPLLNRKRYIPTQGTWKWQPNFSAPGIVEEGAKQIEKYFCEHPDATNYSLAMNDAIGVFDQSPASLARRNGAKNSQHYEDVSDDYFVWANAVVEKVLQRYPDKWFGTLAYYELTDPPKPEIGVNDRIIPFMTQERLRWIDPKLRQIDQQNTIRWANVAQNLGWYDYVYGSMYVTPRVWPHLMQEYLSWGAEHHVKFYSSELYPNWGEGPKAWVMAKLLWNPHQNVDELLDDWYQHTAGQAAAPKLKAYYALWEKFWTQDILHSPWWTGAGPYMPFKDHRYLADVPSSYIERSDALLNEALALADTPQRKARVGKLRETWQRLYKPSIVLYQSDQQALKPITSEAQALETVNNVVAEINEFNIRQKFFYDLASYRADPYYSFMAARMGSAFVLEYMGGDWGKRNPLLGNLLPWIEKSVAVKARMEQVANSNDAAAPSVRIVLASLRNEGTPLLKNSSFEAGLNNWQVTRKTANFPAAYKFGGGNSAEKITLDNAVQASSDMPFSGNAGALVTAAHEGTKVMSYAFISQEIPYQSGSYYLKTQLYQPEDSPMTFVIQQAEIVDEKGKVITNAPYVSSGKLQNLQPGKWETFSFPMILPEVNIKNAQLRVTLAVRTLTVEPRGNFRANQQTYIDAINLYRLNE